MNRADMMELLIYMGTSAAGLKGEPKIYGPLRLIEATQRLAKIMLDAEPENENLKELIESIEADKRKTMTDEEGFYEMLNRATEKLVDCL